MGSRSVRVLEGGPQLPFNPSRIPLSEPGFASCAALGRVKKESVRVGQISHFLPCLRPKKKELVCGDGNIICHTDAVVDVDV